MCAGAAGMMMGGGGVLSGFCVPLDEILVTAIT
jgi:hypothetical protein